MIFVSTMGILVLETVVALLYDVPVLGRPKTSSWH